MYAKQNQFYIDLYVKNQLGLIYSSNYLFMVKYLKCA